MSLEPQRKARIAFGGEMVQRAWGLWGKDGLIHMPQQLAQTAQDWRFLLCVCRTTGHVHSGTLWCSVAGADPIPFAHIPRVAPDRAVMDSMLGGKGKARSLGASSPSLKPSIAIPILPLKLLVICLV